MSNSTIPKEKVKDIERYYEINGDGKNLLFIHGLGSNTRDCDKEVPFYSQNDEFDEDTGKLNDKKIENLDPEVRKHFIYKNVQKTFILLVYT
ncbi:MAG: hypothetical protein ACXAEX_12425 [Promethearchaeota archaeon]